MRVLFFQLHVDAVHDPGRDVYDYLTQVRYGVWDSLASGRTVNLNAALALRAEIAADALRRQPISVRRLLFDDFRQRLKTELFEDRDLSIDRAVAIEHSIGNIESYTVPDLMGVKWKS